MSEKVVVVWFRSFEKLPRFGEFSLFLWVDQKFPPRSGSTAVFFGPHGPWFCQSPRWEPISSCPSSCQSSCPSSEVLEVLLDIFWVDTGSGLSVRFGRTFFFPRNSARPFWDGEWVSENVTLSLKGCNIDLQGIKKSRLDSPGWGISVSSDSWLNLTANLTSAQDSMVPLDTPKNLFFKNLINYHPLPSTHSSNIIKIPQHQSLLKELLLGGGFKDPLSFTWGDDPIWRA